MHVCVHSSVCVCVCVHMCALSHVQLFAKLWTAARQPPLWMKLSRQEYWSMLPFPTPGNLPDPGAEPKSLVSAALAGGVFTISTTWEEYYLL